MNSEEMPVERLLYVDEKKGRSLIRLLKNGMNGTNTQPEAPTT